MTLFVNLLFRHAVLAGREKHICRGSSGSAGSCCPFWEWPGAGRLAALPMGGRCYRGLAGGQGGRISVYGKPGRGKEAGRDWDEGRKAAMNDEEPVDWRLVDGEWSDRHPGRRSQGGKLFCRTGWVNAGKR